MTKDPARQHAIDAAIVEFLIAEDEGSPLAREQWLERHAHIRSELEQFLTNHVGASADLQLLEGQSPATPGLGLEETAEFVARDRTPANSEAAVFGRSERSVLQRAEPGQRIGGIELVRWLGAGGMGEVFEGIDAEGNAVAVKLLQPSRSHTPEALERFRQEGAIASSIVHPRCVFVRTVDRDGNRPFIVMELMTGKTLRDLVRERGRVHYREAVRLILDAAEGLQEAHSHGMIHRDVKPANCYLERNDRVKIGDFGLARSITEESDLTQTGEFVGTPLFASPEQVRGENLDTSTDIYSLAATLYYLLTGQAPFGGLNATGVIASIVSEDPNSPSDLGVEIPPELERVLMQALSRDKNSRPTNMAVFQAQLRPFVSEGVSALVLGKRFAAYMADVGILTIASIFLFFALPWGPIESAGESVQIVGQPAKYQVLGMSLVWWLYFTCSESWNGQSIGKRMLGLRVATYPGGHRASAWRLVWRTSLVLMMLGGLSDFWLYNSGYCETPVQLLVFQYGGYLLQFMLLCSTLLIGNRRRMLHDWLSNTYVVDEPHVQGPVAWDTFVPCRTLNHTEDSSLPDKVDRFSIYGRVAKGEGFAVLEAQDRELARRIWIRIDDNAAEDEKTGFSVPPISGDELSRVNRMRKVENGTWNGRRWVAYVAVDGAPLRRCQFCGFPDLWTVARELLLQWCQESTAMRTEEGFTQLQHPDQIWLDRRGRLVILEFPVDVPGRSTTQNDPVAQSNFPLGEKHDRSSNQGRTSELELAVALWIAEQVLGGQREFLPDRIGDNVASEGPKYILGIVPMHARRILDRLAGTGAPYVSIDSLQADLRASLPKPTQINYSHRMIQFAMAGMTIGLLYGASLSFIKSASLTTTRVTGERILAAETLERVASSPVQMARLKATVSEGTEVPSPQQFTSSAAIAKTHYGAILAKRTEHLNRLESLVLSTVGMENGELGDLKRYQLEFNEGDSAPWVIRAEEALVDFDFSSDELVGIVNLPEQSPLNPVRDQFWFLFAMSMAPMFVLWLWDSITRGGIACWVAGIRFVDSAGRPVRWWRFAFRSFCVWGLPMLAAGCVCLIDIWLPDWTLGSQIAFTLFAAFPLLFFALALVSVRRGLHDYLAGTFVVPR